MKSLLTIAGFDASSGAGVIRDTDTFFSFGFHGIAVPTCTVVQGPGGVSRIEPGAPDLFHDTLRAATHAVRIAAVKIGVLCDEAHVKDTADFLTKRRNVPLIIDPVFAAKNDVPLISDAGRRACLDLLFKKAFIVTPNTDEASSITGIKVTTVRAAKKAAEKIKLSFGPKVVIVKGGHLEGDPVDVLFDGKEFLTHKKKKIPRIVHGTGCSFSSILTCFIASGYGTKDAFRATEDYLERLLKLSYRIDAKGYYYISSASTHAHNDRAKDN
ncbi:MAG: bifunctional hydroxymethylpyrimidine kinase/phosphomethylpyrimidine kinase [Syntrophorhabdaceae bacterium]